MNTVISRSCRLLRCMILIASSASFTAHAQAIDESKVKQLRELKSLCDDGLVSEQVCLEKQRSILGLDTGTSETVRPTGSSESPKTPKTTVDGSRGLSFKLPEGWQSIHSKQMEMGFHLLAGQLQDGDDEAKRQVQKLESALNIAGTEAFSKPGATLLVRPQAATLETSPTSVRELCQQIAQGISAGRERVVYDCGLRELAGRKAIYIEHDSLAKDARTIMYLTAISPGKTVQFVLNSEIPGLESNRMEFDEVVASVRWK